MLRSIGILSEAVDKKIELNNPNKPWFRLVLLEAMLFEPYYALSTEKIKKVMKYLVRNTLF